MDAGQHMGDLYPFSLNDKLKVITEPSPYYASGDNPWGAVGLEWDTTSPPPTENFFTTPVVTHGPYEYNREEVHNRMSQEGTIG